MIRSREPARKAQRFIAATVTAVFVALPYLASAQASGDGFMFKRPSGSLSLRGGYELANTSGQPFTVLQRETTVGSRSFDALNLGADLNFFASRRVDVVMSVDLSSRTKTAEYRDWLENGQPILQQSTLDRASLGAGLRYNFADHGRQISALAYIPARIIPYVGVTGGLMWYGFEQKGDFVERSSSATPDIFADELHSSQLNLMGQAYAGIDRRINARWSLIGEARYTQSTAKLTSDYAGLGNIQLSGLALNAGVAVRY